MNTDIKIIDNEEYIGMKGCAEILDVSLPRVRYLIKKRKLNAKKLGKKHFIKKIDLENFIVYRKEKSLLITQLAQKRRSLLAEYQILYNQERDKVNLKIESLKKKYPY